MTCWQCGKRGPRRSVADDRSDLDIGVLARAGSIERVWKEIELELNDVGGFSIRWENPVHIFKGMTHCVYRPARADRWLDLDIGVFQDGTEDLYLQPQRHGRATILFDRSEGQRTADVRFDDMGHRQRMREMLHQEIMRWNLYRDFVAKEIARGRTIDAFGFYLAFAVRPVVTVLGMLHRPDRFDYGFRYVKDELPADAVEGIERLCYVATPGELLSRVDEADRLFMQLLKR